MSSEKKVLLSAVQPTNPMTLGNLIGAVGTWQRYQEDFDTLFFAVDLHAITARLAPEILRENTHRTLATYIASGVDPERSTLFVQSHVPEHSELAWVLTCNSYIGELSRMTQYKDKAAKQDTNIPAGLFVYPVLMAADILLYQTNIVPVGDDQRQHVELTRDIAVRMNHTSGQELFTIPEARVPEVGARIMSLQDPTKKMSKSDSDPKATVFITDTDKQIVTKIKGAVTDSGSEISDAPDKPGIRNLLQIQSALTGKTIPDLVRSYEGKMYGHLKVDTADLVVARVAPLRAEVDKMLADRTELERILRRGAEKARERAQVTLRRTYDALGFVRPN
jgi:tryptophanyl-tRNA synthetase